MTFGVNDDNITEKDFDFRMRIKELLHGSKRAGKILFVAVEIGEDVALGAAQATVDGVVHAVVFLDEGAHARIARKPVERAVVGTGILNDMFPRDAGLVGDRGDAQLQP